MKKLKIVFLAFLGIFLLIGIFFFSTIKSCLFTYTTDDGYIYIKPNDQLTDVVKELKPFVTNTETVEKVAEFRDYNNSTIKAGKYKITKGMRLLTLINNLRAGKQVEVQFTFSNIETLEQLASRIQKKLPIDSATFVKYVTSNEFLTKNNLNEANVKQIFLPNTYSFYYTVTKEEFTDKMLQNYRNFWNEKRQEEAKKLKLTPDQVMILASIVQKESAKADDQPKVARLYLNRLDKGMKLQADPTVIYAWKIKDGFDLVINRVLNKHLTINSPYNTYMVIGLPPAPITMVSAEVIDRVLNAPPHNYIYMCASTEKYGYHEFAEDFETHNENAKKYSIWIKEYLEKKKAKQDSIAKEKEL